MSIAFLLTSLVIVATPGTGVLSTLATGRTAGRRASFVAAIGCTLGIVPHLVAALLGLAAVLPASALAFQVVKYPGVAYLLYLAWTTRRDQPALTVPPGALPRSARQMIGSAILVNVLKPKLSIFFLAFLPQFVTPGEVNAVPRMLALGAVFMLLTLIVFAGYGVAAAAVRVHVATRPRALTWLRRGFAGAFVALGARLALTDR